MIYPQTNVRLPSPLITAAKSRAVAENCSMREIFENALRDYIAKPLETDETE